jgi:Asp-tRNA(Asn)/Glu-tRNA(Gln) amidotransferase A subunit family amidase
MSKPTGRSYVTSLGAFRSGTDSPRDFLERSLARLKDWEGKIHAFVNTNILAAREAADRSSERWRSARPLSPIDGMPVGVKDIMETADMPTEQGSPLFAGWRSVRDAAAVSGLREAGAVILGKTVTTEFAATEPGPTRNPWDTSRTPAAPAAAQRQQLLRESYPRPWARRLSDRLSVLRAIAAAMATNPVSEVSIAEEVLTI